MVAIAAPDSGGRAVLDYERELRNVLAAVRAGRQDAADVRVVPFATVTAICDELGRGLAFAARLCRRGAAPVITTETSVIDTYATRLLARVYGFLARSGNPDIAGVRPRHPQTWLPFAASLLSLSAPTYGRTSQPPCDGVAPIVSTRCHH